MLCLLGRCLSEVLFPLECKLLGDSVSVVCFVGCASALPTKSSLLPPVAPVLGFILKMLSILIFSHEQNGFVVSAFYVHIPSSPAHSAAAIPRQCVLGTFAKDQSGGVTSGLRGAISLVCEAGFLPVAHILHDHSMNHILKSAARCSCSRSCGAAFHHSAPATG